PSSQQQPPHTKTKPYPFLVIGSGLAGLAFALKASQWGKVLILSKTDLHSTNSAMAQGGIAAAIGDGDSFDQHVQDTLIAGAGLCKESVVRDLVSQAPERIDDLIRWGIKFDVSDTQGFELTREGGHSKRRILHIADHTG